MFIQIFLEKSNTSHKRLQEEKEVFNFNMCSVISLKNFYLTLLLSLCLEQLLGVALRISCNYQWIDKALNVAVHVFWNWN